MLLSKKWLSDYVKLEEMLPRRFADDLTMSGSKVEGYKTEGGELHKIVVGRVLAVERHKGADSLYVCRVEAGGDAPIQIVTGAANVTAGAMVPVALHGSVIHGGKKITKGKLRGEESCGMLCSLEELGLTKGDFPYADEDGIFLLEEPDLTPGQDIREALGLNDTVFEFEITSNRPDCLCVLGLAREAAATYRVPFDPPAPRVKGSGGDINDYLKVSVENPQLCLRYAAAAVRNVRIAPSPRWLRERLRASGVRPINNIVDITNYVMLEYGQPMHAFDLEHVQGSSIIVRNAAPGEQIMTLDGVVRTLAGEMLVIADAKAPTAVAGVMGGEWSGVYDTTRTVIFESACFFGPSVRTTSRALGLRTESSGRFEKGLDPQNCIPALRRACELVELLNAGDVVDGVIDVAGDIPEPARIPLDPDWINAFLGVEIPGEEMVRSLRSLGYAVERSGSAGGPAADAETGSPKYMVTAPSYRADAEGPADLAEEIARIYGYNNIPTAALRGTADGRLSPEQLFAREVNRVLLSQGMSEIITYSFISPKYYDKIAMPEDSPLRRSVVISNPLGEDTSVMRTTAFPSMLEILSRNYNNRVPAAWLYEIATIYLPKQAEDDFAGEGAGYAELGRRVLPDERSQVMLGLYGGGADFYTLKGAVELLLERAGISDWEVAAEKGNPTFHPGRCATLKICGEDAGVLGQVHPAVCGGYGMEAEVYMAGLDFPTLLRHQNPERSFKHLPRFPASTRDLALVCGEELPVMEIQKALTASIGSILEEISLFDIYRGKQVGEGKKSVAYSLTLRAGDRTLTDEECDKAVAKALAELEKLDVRLRA